MGYLITIILLMFLIDYLFMIFCNNVLFNIFDWFNKIPIITKLFILLIGGMLLFLSIIYLFVSISSLINGLILYLFPSNTFTFVSSIIIVILNILLCIKILWKAIPEFTFWNSIEFIIVAFIIISINWLFIARHKMKEN